jgi:hypothetical protein
MVMVVCEELEKRLVVEAACGSSLRPDYMGELADSLVDDDLRLSEGNAGPVLEQVERERNPDELEAGVTDRKAYYREYMRKRRALLRATPMEQVEALQDRLDEEDGRL